MIWNNADNLKEDDENEGVTVRAFSCCCVENM